MHGSLLEQSSGPGATALSVPVPVTLGAQETNKLSVLSETSKAMTCRNPGFCHLPPTLYPYTEIPTTFMFSACQLRTSHQEEGWWTRVRCPSKPSSSTLVTGAQETFPAGQAKYILWAQGWAGPIGLTDRRANSLHKGHRTKDLGDP